ncbi:MAG TPA: right-handed parallel beta-helix repeat-containing protein [Prosthecobacter sp.]|nr:right-handed parallel beta-helix repeat-containing protein [Prosthecobacter sp.]
MRPSPLLITASLLLAFPSARADVKTVTTREDLRQALTRLAPGATLKIAPGEYGPGHAIPAAQGTAAKPIVIEAADPKNPPRFTGGAVALHLQGCAFITIRHLHIQGQTGNGINLDDGGASSHHITLEHLFISDIGPKGNTDGIKLSGLTDFAVRHCRITGWGGQAIDMVGCHRGLVESCHFEGKDGFAQATGPQAKGGSEDIVIRACTLVRAGQRPVHLGGSTGRPYFRPADAKYEARRITVEGCLIIGGMAGAVFTGSEDCSVRFNTFLNPEVWALRILQENQEPGMIPCRNNTFENNIITVTQGALRTWLNNSSGTAPETFKFANNWWFHHGQTQRPNLPSPELNGAYNLDPRLDANHKPQTPAAQSLGHTAFKPR